MTINPASFRDSSGFVFYKKGTLYRQINEVYGGCYRHLMHSGLYNELVESGLLITHKELASGGGTESAYMIIQPEEIDFISYPFEWCFSQLKDAALTTLTVQKKALEYGMSLKDASAYNIQFYEGRPVLIDTLSFELYAEGGPWVAYNQFCQHFLAPLALMSYRDVRLSQLLRVYLDGIPLDLAGKLMPKRTYLNHSLLMHLHLHSRTKKSYSNNPSARNNVRNSVSLKALKGIIDSLESTIKGLDWNPDSTIWSRYYTQEANYDLDEKKRIIEKFLDKANPERVWDLGANVGFYSRVASDKGIPTIAFDVDPSCVEANYNKSRDGGEKNILPLVVDLSNPSPPMGWVNRERSSLLERGPVDAILALALIHHLALGNNVSLEMLASFFNSLCNTLIIEFVPKNDSNAQKLLAGKGDIFPEYNMSNFETEFGKYFRIEDSERIKGTERIIYLMVSL